MSKLEILFNEIDSLHKPNPCTDGSEIDCFNDLHNYNLPSDLKAFYRKYKSVKLYESKYGFTYRFVPVSEIRRTRIDIYGEDTDEWGPNTWLTICDVMDGNYIAIDIASGNGELINFIDCFHETFAQPGECKIVARSFTELLEKALHGGEGLYYLQKDFIGYGDGLPLTAANAALRIENAEAPRKGWLVKFSVAHTSYSEFFADNDYGSKEKSFDAVKQFIEEKRIDKTA
jgi:hypothetical protein